jgi:hypothetical protein
MDEPRSAASGGTGSEQPEPLGDLAGHAQEVIGAVRRYAMILVDEAVAKVRASIIRVALFVFALALALIVSALGASLIISGSVDGLAVMVGSIWAARIIVGTACLACAAAVIIGPLWNHRRKRMRQLRNKYSESAKGSR